MAAETPRPLARWRSRLGIILVGGAAFAALAGCIPFPLTRTTPVPDFSQRLPADLLARSDEVLVLIQAVTSTREHQEREVSLDAMFVKAYELRTLNQQLPPNFYTESDYLISIGALSKWGRQLHRICVLARDGRVIVVDFLLSDNDQVEALSQELREDTVTALREGSAVVSWTERAHASAKPRFLPTPKPWFILPLYAMKYGPCGVAVTGATTWDSSLRSRVADYISALPVWHP